MEKYSLDTLLGRVNSALEAKKLPATQPQIAKLLGIKQPSVSLWKTGGPRNKHVVKLAMILGVCVDWIWTGREPRSPVPAQEKVAQDLWNVWPRLEESTKQQLLGHALMSIGEDGPQKKPPHYSTKAPNLRQMKL